MGEIVLDVKNLRKHYPLSQSWLSVLRQESPACVHAVDGVSFCLRRGEILALVGESGSGKTTTGLCTLGLVESTQGVVQLDGENVFEMVHDSRRKDLRRKAQMIFQDPYESLNPRQTVYQAVAEPLKVHHLATIRLHNLKLQISTKPRIQPIMKYAPRKLPN